MQKDGYKYIFCFDKKPTEYTAQYDYPNKCKTLKVAEKYSVIYPNGEVYA